MLNHGTDVPELLAQLDRLTTTTKSVIKDTDKVVLECNVGDGIQSWTVRNGSCSLPDGAVVKKGTSFNGFQEAIETLDSPAMSCATLPQSRYGSAGTLFPTGTACPRTAHSTLGKTCSPGSTSSNCP